MNMFKFIFLKFYYKICMLSTHLIPNKKLRKDIKETYKYKLVVLENENVNNIQMLDSTLSIEYIIKNKCNVSRYGDGEIGYLLDPNFHHFFQPYNPKLVEKLKYILQHPIDNCLICIPIWMKNLNTNIQFHQKCIVNFWFKFYKYINKNYTYGCANLFCPSSLKINSIEHIKQIWNNEDIVIVTGINSSFIFENYLFDNTKSVNFIYSKAVDAFSEYDTLLNKIKTDKTKLYLLSLGLTATVLAYDLAKINIRAIDIGHITNYYLESIGKMKNIEQLRQSREFIDGKTDIRKNLE